MGGWNKPTARVRITHKPTGVSALAEGGSRASLNKLRAHALVLLRARMNTRVSGIKEPTEVTHNYRFPDDDPSPNDITKYRTERTKEK